MERAYEDAYRQFIEPIVGASGEHLGFASGESRFVHHESRLTLDQSRGADEGIFDDADPPR
jgi:hypothetical protein